MLVVGVSVVVVVGVDVVVVLVVGFGVVVVFSNVVSTLDESNRGIVEVSINTPVVSVVSTGSVSVGLLDSIDALLVLCSLPKPVVFNSTVVDLEPKRSPTGVVDSSTTIISTKCTAPVTIQDSVQKYAIHAREDNSKISKTGTLYSMTAGRVVLAIYDNEILF